MQKTGTDGRFPTSMLPSVLEILRLILIDVQAIIVKSHISLIGSVILNDILQETCDC